MFWAAEQRRQQLSSFVNAILDDSAPMIRRTLTPDVITTDVTTPLLDLVSPQIRPVAPTLLSESERQVLDSVVQTMLAYNLTYRQERTPTGGYLYKLDPPVDALADFAPTFVEDRQGAARNAIGLGEQPAPPNPRSVAREKRLTYNTKQLIVAQITTAKFAKTGAGAAVEAEPPKEVEADASQDAERKKREEADAFIQARMGLKQQAGARTAAIAGLSTREEVDFFGRKKARKAAPSEATPVVASAAPERNGPKVFFKFQEGFSSAVRKPLKLGDLL